MAPKLRSASGRSDAEAARLRLNDGNRVICGTVRESRVGVGDGYLPESRAEECEDEYKQVDYAFRKLIGPYVDQSLRRKIKPERHVTPNVYK